MEVPIAGMDCTECARHVQRVIEKLRGLGIDRIELISGVSEEVAAMMAGDSQPFWPHTGGFQFTSPGIGCGSPVDPGSGYPCQFLATSQEIARTTPAGLTGDKYSLIVMVITDTVTLLRHNIVGRT